MKIVYDIDNDRVVSEDESNLVFHTLPLSCPDEVIYKVVEIFNEVDGDEEYVGSSSELDDYLLDEYRCTQDDREFIIESIYKFLYPEEKKTWFEVFRCGEDGTETIATFDTSEECRHFICGESLVSKEELFFDRWYQVGDNTPNVFVPKYPCLMVWDTPNVLKTLVFFYSKDNGICVYTEDPNFHSLIGVKYDWDIMDFEEFTPSEY